MELPVIHLFTHDSIGLGEDGPTHQPVEQLASPAGDPRPRRDPPRRRQRGRRGLAGGARPHPPAGGAGPHPPGRAGPRPLAGTRSAEGLRRGGYVLADAEGGDPEVILIATGSEVALAVARPRGAERRRDRARGSSACPAGSSSTARTQAYRDEVLPPSVTARVSVEEASTLGWDRYVGPRRQEDRHAHLRHLGAAQGRAEQVRLHPRQGRRGGQGGSIA